MLNSRKSIFVFLSLCSLIFGSIIIMLSMELFQTADATDAKVLIERGRDYEIWNLGGNERKFVAGVAPWVYDEAQDRYVPHIVRDYGNGNIEVQSGMIGWIIGPEESIITGAGDSSDKRVTEFWVVNDGALSFLSRSIIENDSGVYVTNSYSLDMNSYSLNVKGTDAIVDITYAIHDGLPTERIVEFTGITDDEVAQSIEIERHWIPLTDIKSVIFDNGESVDNVGDIKSTSDAASPDNSVHFIDDNGNTIVFENLKTAGEKFKKVDYQKNLITFTYGNFGSATDLLLIDDTFADLSTHDGSVFTEITVSSSCGSPVTKDAEYYVQARAGYNNEDSCARGFAEWVIDSIPDDAVITDTDFKFEVRSVASPRNCDFMPLTNQPSATSSASTLWDDIGDGTAYLSNDSTCTTTGQNKQVDLGSSADSEVDYRLTNGDWFAIGFKLVSETRDSTGHESDIAESSAGGVPIPTLEVTYTV